VIPPRKKTAVPARTTLITPRTYTETGIVEARTIQSGVYLGRTMLPPCMAPRNGSPYREYHG